MSSAETRSFGVGLFLLVDALFFGGVFFICVNLRANLGVWPDPPASAVPSVLPGLATVLVGFGWLAHQRRASLLLPFACVAVALGTLAFFWFEAAAAGLTWQHTRYGLMVYGLTVVWALHLCGALVALGVQLLRGRGANDTRLLRRFLIWQTVVGGALVVVVF